VVLTDNAGVGLSTGAAQKTVAGMARDAASLIDALGLERVAPEGAEASSG
jgi:pimeloyl-ACP methyl ester carboxylesterase